MKVLLNDDGSPIDHELTREYCMRLIDLADLLMFTHKKKIRDKRSPDYYDPHTIFLVPLNLIITSGYTMKDLFILNKILSSGKKMSLLETKLSDREVEGNVSISSDFDDFSDIHKRLKDRIKERMLDLPESGIIILYLNIEGVHNKVGKKTFSYPMSRTSSISIFFNAVVDGPIKSGNVKLADVKNCPQMKLALNEMLERKLNLPHGIPVIINNENGYSINKEKYAIQKVFE